MSPSCGLAATRRTLVAVVASADGRCRRPLTAARTAEARHALVSYLLSDRDLELVVCEDVLADSIVEVATRNGIPTWIAPARLVEALCVATGTNPRSARPVARFLARVPRAPALRPLLRRLTPAGTEPNQLPLL